MKRRDFIKYTGAVAAAAPLMNFAGSTPVPRMIVLGFDGMDHATVWRLMQKGDLPNMRKLASRGIFSGMKTTIPPQSPVAWGSFITGADPGVYGIYDFLHRDPKTYIPKFSQTETLPAEWHVPLFKYNIPLKSAQIVLKREGKPFWDYLEERDVDATIFKIPSNFPPSKSKQRTISGMGTPSIRDGYGFYTLYTSDEEESMKDISPNHVYYAYINEDDVMEDGVLEGPVNDLVKSEDGEVVKPKLTFKVYLDNDHKTARIDIDGKEVMLSQGEYSDWVEIEFPLIKNITSITGMVKFYLLEMGERFRLYISPIHISPKHPATTISTPASYSEELADHCGLFHTISLPADTHALSKNTFSMENFVVQSMSVFQESKKIFSYEYERFLSGKSPFLFFYFSSLDQGQHMFWSLTDKMHPYYHPDVAQKFGFMIDELYRKHDEILGKVLKETPPDVRIIVMSDHGFAPFRRTVNINTWLHKEGYLKLDIDDVDDEVSLIEYADWGRTRAYGMGLNGLYLNMKGRESQGIVSKEERRKLLEEIKGKLELLTDPKTGERVVTQAFISEDHFSKDFLDRAPDIIVGFNLGYRTSGDSALGGMNPEIVGDNMDWWAGDHCMCPSHVPATLITNFKINRKIPEMRDMAPTILKHFGIEHPSTMTGKSLI
jgi:predicted AlkP superfamily phosphohydrolase/phosphomutase